MSVAWQNWDVQGQMWSPLSMNLSIRMEAAFNDEPHIAGFSGDMEKCYDSLPMDVVLGICRTLGMHTCILTGLAGAYDKMQRIITLNNGFGGLWRALTGAVHGVLD